MRVLVVVRETDDGKFIATCDAPYAVAQGDSEEEALRNIADAIHDLLNDPDYGPIAREQVPVEYEHVRRAAAHLVTV